MIFRTRRAGLAGFLTPACTSLLIASGVRGWGAPRSQDPAPEVELGRLLFWDPVLSGELDVAGATCHHLDFVYVDGRNLAPASGATRHPVAFAMRTRSRSHAQFPTTFTRVYQILPATP
ncbi:MAG: hypothetical protein OXT72_15270 [Gammaproteobacteria bacterium]|nr:hypothetical protein [Gammaproteobacteria bacterium]MDE0248344.1 hypothetical protein [Gammaproteobacteria bacterium]